jgi:hypothetical protein
MEDNLFTSPKGKPFSVLFLPFCGPLPGFATIFEIDLPETMSITLDRNAGNVL